MSDIFPPDFAVIHNEQLYRPVYVRPYTRKDGRLSRLIEWLTNCPSCGVEFTTTTTMLAQSRRRQCDACKAPGQPVRIDGKLFRSQIRGDAP